MPLIDDIVAMEEELKTWRRDIHAHPEIAFEEHRTAAIVAEKLESFGIEVRYLHSEIDALERVERLRDLRLGVVDVLIGFNLLREGLDLRLPAAECSSFARS